MIIQTAIFPCEKKAETLKETTVAPKADTKVEKVEAKKTVAKKK